MTNNGWRPIAEAPRDGTLVDLWVIEPDGDQHRVCGCWFENYEWVCSFGLVNVCGRVIRHFMHLPQPPHDERA
jgi:hypothetical protein